MANMSFHKKASDANKTQNDAQAVDYQRILIDRSSNGQNRGKNHRNGVSSQKNRQTNKSWQTEDNKNSDQLSRLHLTSCKLLG